MATAGVKPKCAEPCWHTLTRWPASSLPSVYLREWKLAFTQRLFIKLKAALFVMANNRKHTHTCKHTHIYKLQLKATFLRKILVRITKEEIEWIYLGKISGTVVIKNVSDMVLCNFCKEFLLKMKRIKMSELFELKKKFLPIIIVQKLCWSHSNCLTFWLLGG